MQNAIAWIQQARKLDAGKGDISLEEKERQLTLEYYDGIIEQWEKALSADPQTGTQKVTRMRLPPRRIFNAISYNLWFNDIRMNMVTATNWAVFFLKLGI